MPEREPSYPETPPGSGTRKPARCRYGIGKQLATRALIEVDPDTLCVATTPGAALMVGDEPVMQEHVAIDEHEVVAACGGEREIAQSSDPETAMRLTDMS